MSTEFLLHLNIFLAERFWFQAVSVSWLLAVGLKLNADIDGYLAFRAEGGVKWG